MMPRRFQPVIALAAVMTVAVFAAVAVGAAEPGPGTCNRNTAKAASVEFTVPNGKAVREQVPLLGKAPELDAISEPIDVVVFNGPHHSVPLFPGLQQGEESSAAPPVFNNVVCVLAPSGEEMYYFDVDLAGLRLDGLVVDRRHE